MKENLEAMQKMGINIPVILGGAALTDNFVEDFCRPIYDGPIFYCKDAFEGITAMSRIEAKNYDTDFGRKVLENAVMKANKETKEIPPFAELKMPSRTIKIPTPPFWGRRVLKTDVKELAYSWINHKILFAQRWGYSGKGQSKEEKQKQLEEVLYPTYERVKADIERLGLFEPTLIYGYYPARSRENELYLFDESEGYFSEAQVNRESIDVVAKRAIKVFDFPRQNRAPHRCLSDFIHSERHDVLALTCVSAGAKFSAYEKELYDAGNFTEYFFVHGLGVELAEALAEIVHKQIRLDLGIAEHEGHSLRDVQMKRYHGCRYSFGYPACPNLEDTKIIFDLLKPEEFGINLSETFQIHPEQSTTAIVMHHKEALYFNV